MYGLHQGALLSLNILTMCLMGWLCGMALECIVYLVAYMPLRSYAGGYHAKTPFRCYLLSIVMMAVTLSAIGKLFWSLPMVIAIIIFAVTTIILLAPVEDPNKPLSLKESTAYKKSARIILCVLTIIQMLLWAADQKSLSACVTVALATLSLMLIAGKIKNKRLGSSESSVQAIPPTPHEQNKQQSL